MTDDEVGYVCGALCAEFTDPDVDEPAVRMRYLHGLDRAELMALVVKQSRVLAREVMGDA